MRKKHLILVLIISLILSSAYATVFPNHFGASIALGGRNDNMLQTSLSFTAYPIHFEFCTPFIFTEAYVQLSDTSLSFGGFRGGLGLELMYITGHPFSFMNMNPTAWSPAMLAGVDYEKSKLRGYVQLSLLRFMEKDAIYEYLTPFIDFSKSKIERFGILMFRFSGLF